MIEQAGSQLVLENQETMLALIQGAEEQTLLSGFVERVYDGVSTVATSFDTATTAVQNRFETASAVREQATAKVPSLSKAVIKGGAILLSAAYAAPALAQPGATKSPKRAVKGTYSKVIATRIGNECPESALVTKQSPQVLKKVIKNIITVQVKTNEDTETETYSWDPKNNAVACVAFGSHTDDRGITKYSFLTNEMRSKKSGTFKAPAGYYDNFVVLAKRHK